MALRSFHKARLPALAIHRDHPGASISGTSPRSPGLRPRVPPSSRRASRRFAPGCSRPIASPAPTSSDAWCWWDGSIAGSRSTTMFESGSSFKATNGLSTGVYTGVPAAFRPGDLFEPNADGTLPDRVIVVDVFKDYPIGNSRSCLAQGHRGRRPEGHAAARNTANAGVADFAPGTGRPPSLKLRRVNPPPRELRAAGSPTFTLAGPSNWRCSSRTFATRFAT